MARIFGKLSATLSKYRAHKKEIDNITFASQAEASRYIELKIRLQAGEILGLVLQPRYVLQEGFTDNTGERHRPIVYIPDFEYYDNIASAKIVEDVKGFKTPEYQIKKKWFIKKYIEPYTDVAFREIMA